MKRIPLLLAAAVISASLPSCSKAEAPDSAVRTAQTEQTASSEAETTTAAEKPKDTSSVKSTETEPAETTAKTSEKTKKKKKRSKTSAAIDDVTAEDTGSDEEISDFETCFDKETGFFGDKAVNLLGREKNDLISQAKYDKDYLVESTTDEDGAESFLYVVNSDRRISFRLVFRDGILDEISCNTSMDDFKSALSAAKKMGWELKESVKGRRTFAVTGGKAVYSICKIRDDDGISYAAQSYVKSV